MNDAISSPSSWNVWERIDEAAWPATDRAAQPPIGSLFQPAGRLRQPRDHHGHCDRFSTAEWCRRTDRKGTLIRHARRRVTLPVGTLPVAMIEPAFRTPLVAAVGGTVLLAPGFATASRAAIALSAIAVRANPEHRLASLAATKSRSENHFCMNRHLLTPAGFDNGNGSCQGRTSFDGGLLMKVAKPEPRCLEQRGSLPPSQSHHTVFRGNVLMLRICGAPSAEMRAPAPPLQSAKAQKTTLSDDRQQ
jgi:hypothetical protein